MDQNSNRSSPGQQREGPEFSADRRRVLRGALVLGALPLAGGLPGTQAALAGQRGTSPRTRAAAQLSSQQMAGQRVIFSYPGLTVPSALLQRITAGEAAGVIFFGSNISSEAQIASVIQQLRVAQQQSPVPSPLLLMTDQEGGEVRRLPGAPSLSEKQIGKSANPSSAAAQAGTEAGQNLAGADMNVNLAGAVFKKEPEIVRLLLDAGADPAAGQPSAADTAAMFGNEDFLAWFAGRRAAE